MLTPSDESQFIRSSPRPLRFAWRCLVLLAIITSAATVGWFAARAYYAPNTLGLILDSGGASEQDFERFKKLADAAKEYLSEHDGYLPADPYRSLIESEKVVSYNDFRFEDRVVAFDIFDLPGRLNVQLSKNPNHTLFSVNYPSLDEEWSMLMNGQVLRRPAGKFTQDDLDWSHNFHNTGYPYWESIPDKQNWLDANREKLTWHPEYEMYVPDKPSGGGSLKP